MRKDEDITAYKEKLEDGTYALRVGKEVPEGDVNLSYIHTPRLDSDENVSLVGTASTAENMIPYDQREGLVAPDEEGKLSYVELHGNIDSIRNKEPKEVFPSEHVNITRMFKNNIHRSSEGLFYKFEIKYHYDSKRGEPNKVEKYTGDQIHLTDENGNPIGSEVKHDIYVMAMSGNPNIYWVKIYMNLPTNEIDTFKIKYNHIDNVVSENYVQITKEELELYMNSNNTINIYGKTKQLVENGKLRIVNAKGSYEKVDKDTLRNATPDDEYYYSELSNEKGGYNLFVTQRSEFDPRPKRMFNYKVMATYKDKEGKEQQVTSGYISDWVVHPEALLQNEKYEYTKEWKKIGIPFDGYKLNVKDMAEISLPPGTPSIPEEASFEILDAQGNLLYSVVDAQDNPGVDTAIQEGSNNFGSAKAVDISPDPWSSAQHPNTHIKSLPIDHTVTVIAEEQKTQWGFEFEVTGQGLVGTPSVYTGNWWVCALTGIYKDYSDNYLPLQNKTNWLPRTSSTPVSAWATKSGDNGLTYVEVEKDDTDIMGLYMRNNRSGSAMSTAKDYEFSTSVKVLDPGGSNVIGIMFRIKDNKNYYMFAWEREDILYQEYEYTAEDYPNGSKLRPESNNPRRVSFENGGCTEFTYNPSEDMENIDSKHQDYFFQNMNDYEEYGFGDNKKRIYKATERSSSAAKAEGYTASAADKTGSSFKDVTVKDSLYESEEGKIGWEVGKEYKITVMVSGSDFKIYINDNPYSTSRGFLVCTGKDSEHKTGSIGFASVAQKWVRWSAPIYNEIEMKEVCTDPVHHTFYNNKEVRVSGQRVYPLMKDLIEKYAKDTYGKAKYDIFGYVPHSDQNDLFVEIDEENNGFVWAYTTSDKAGGIQQEDWTTEDNHMTVNGSGHVNYHADGHFTITMNPEILPTDKIPNYVQEFTWNNPIITSGENIEVLIKEDGKTLNPEAEIPSIKDLNRKITITPDPIHKEDDIVSLIDLQGENGIIKQLDLPQDVNLTELMLRIERGEPDNHDYINQEHRVNYRFRTEEDGYTRLPVDQFKDYLGVNRLRVGSLYNQYLPVEFELDYEVLVPMKKTTNMQKLFADNAEGAVMIESSPGISTWEVVDGVLVDNENKSEFVGAFNLQHLDYKNHITDFTFKPIGIDDDLIGVIFRVQDKDNFYFYAMEADDIDLTERANRMEDNQPAGLFDWTTYRRRDTTAEDYVENRGWRRYHQRVYKVKNGRKTVVADRSMVSNSGYIRNWHNNIRVECAGKQTNLYFQTGVINDENWDRIFQIDTEWDKGAFGVFNYSQRVEFLDIQTTDMVPVSGTIHNLNYVGNPQSIIAKNTKSFCHDYVVSSMKAAGFTGSENYTPLSYTGKVTGDSGEVNIALNGEGPIQVFSEIDPTQTIADVDLVAWTHHEDLEATPLFAITIDDEKRIDIEKPKVEKEKLEMENWYLRIKNGNFEKQIELPYYEPEEKIPKIYESYPMLKDYAPKEVDDVETVTLEYTVDEYTNQEFYHREEHKPGIILVDNEQPIVLDEFALKAKNSPISLSSVYDISYIEAHAFRNNKARKLRIKDIDAEKGIVYLLDRVREEDVINLRYAYEERYYTYRGFNKEDDHFHLDLNPSPGHTHTTAYDGFYRWIPLDKDSTRYETTEISSNEFLVKQVHVYLRPSLIRDKNDNIIPGTKSNKRNIFHTTEEEVFNEKNYNYDMSLYRLGKVMIQSNSDIHKDTTILDNRSRGGGLDDAISREIIKQINIESLQHWDLGSFDGEAYQENGVIIIKVPKRILKGKNNPHGFSENEIEAAVQKHKAYGILPIIEYYDSENEEESRLSEEDYKDAKFFEI